MFGRGGLPATDVYVRCFGRVFYGIVNQVADDVAEVRTVCREGKSGRLDVRRDMHGLLRLQFMLLDKRFENAFHGQRFRMQAEGLAAFHAHGEYLLDKSAEPLQLLLADAQILVALCLFFRLVKVQQGIVGGIGYGDRGFQFVGDVVGKVAFHLLQRLLLQDGADKYPEREAEDDEDNERGSQNARHLLQHQRGNGFHPKAVALMGTDVESVLV